VKQRKAVVENLRGQLLNIANHLHQGLIEVIMQLTFIQKSLSSTTDTTNTTTTTDTIHTNNALARALHVPSINLVWTPSPLFPYISTFSYAKAYASLLHPSLLPPNTRSVDSHLIHITSGFLFINLDHRGDLCCAPSECHDVDGVFS
jgi:hypothetical protein